MNPLDRTRAWFVGRSTRERWLLLAFLLVGVVLWLGSLAERAHVFTTQARSLGARVETQEVLLGSRAAVSARLAEQLQRIEPARTLNATRLVAEISSLAGRLQLNHSIESPRTEPVDQFFYHTTEVIVRRAELAKLISFSTEVTDRSPYLTLEQTAIAADPSNPSLLDARFRVSAVEIPPKP